MRANLMAALMAAEIGLIGIGSVTAASAQTSGGSTPDRSPKQNNLSNPAPQSTKSTKRSHGQEKGIIFVGGKNGTGQPGSTRMINPQPLPPGGKVFINPQPLPPGAR